MKPTEVPYEARSGSFPSDEAALDPLRINTVRTQSIDEVQRADCGCRATRRARKDFHIID